MALNIIGAAARSLSFKCRTIGGYLGHHQVERTINNFIEPRFLPRRNISFLNRITGEDLWKSCTSVSNAGKKRGRAREAGKGLTKNLNKGQIIGVGRKNLILPGLNTRVRNGFEIASVGRGADDPAWSEKLYNIRDMNRNKRRFKVSGVERGYSGSKLAGRSVGVPEPIGLQDFTGFDTRCIEMKIVNTMKAQGGRTRRHFCMVVTGNHNGVLGIGMARSPEGKSAIAKAKQRSASKLMHFDLCEGRTVYHDFFTQFGQTKIYAYKMPEGYGLQTHRIIKTICQLIGIKDLRTKCEGSTNPQKIVKAFLVGLLQQKTYQQLAEDKKMFLVEFATSQHNFPKIVGIPTVCRTADQIPSNENLDFKQHVLHGKVILKPAPRRNPYEKLPSFQIHLKRQEKKRSWPAIQKYLRVRYGETRSFLADQYPEARSNDNNKY